MYDQDKLIYIKRRLVEIFTRNHTPKKELFLKILERVNEVLSTESDNMRPHDSSGLPGGMMQLKKNIPTIILADIHARRDYVISILFKEGMIGYTVLENLLMGLVQIVCVGDGLHAEERAAKRWAAAFDEYKNGFKVHDNMDEEMHEGFGVMEMIMELKTLFPENFHFLKGNHENISNEKVDGNQSFAKYAHEGPMVAYYVKRFYGEEIFNQYYQFEKNLPIFAIGKNFLVSHAEPGKFFQRQEIIEYRKKPEVVLGLTWTDDDAAENGSVEKMLEVYIDKNYFQDSYYFGGHRPIDGLFNPRAKGKYIQIHNPEKFVFGIIHKDKSINLEKDIIEIKNKIRLIDDPCMSMTKTIESEQKHEEKKINDTLIINNVKEILNNRNDVN